MRTLLKVGFSMLVLAFALIGAAYAMLKANGVTRPVNYEGRKIESANRQVSAKVTEVELSGPIDLTLRYGTTPSLVIQGEQRLLGNVETSQSGNTLHIGTRGIVLRHNQPLQATLVLPALARLSVDGSGDTTVSGFAGERITLALEGSGSVKFNGRYRMIDASLHGSGDVNIDTGTFGKAIVKLVGSGSMTLAGYGDELVAEVTGSGGLDAQHLRCDAVKISQMGSGSSTVTAQKEFKASISGSGDIDVYGNPAERSVARTGSGSVTFNQ